LYLSPATAVSYLKKQVSAAVTPAISQPIIELASLTEFAKSPIPWFFTEKLAG
jgi:hypothetical protein